MRLDLLGVVTHDDRVLPADRTSAAHMTEYLIKVLGVQETKRALGLASTNIVISWRNGASKPTDLNASRLAVAYGVTKAIDDRYGTADNNVAKTVMTRGCIYLDEERPDDAIARLSPREGAVVMELVAGRFSVDTPVLTIA